MVGKKVTVQFKKKELSKSYIWHKLMPLLVLPVARHRHKALRSWEKRRRMCRQSRRQPAQVPVLGPQKDKGRAAKGNVRSSLVRQRP